MCQILVQGRIGKFRYLAAGFTDCKRSLGCLFWVIVIAGNEGIQAFQPMGQAEFQQSVQRTIDLNWRAQPIIAQLIQNGIGAERLIRCIQDAIDQCLIFRQRTGR